jgi:L-alanine-DL-glutamate epimerase-like enolase superfamily enzyme
MPAANISSAPFVRVLAVETGVRPMTLRLPFKFGAVTLTRCPQVVVRATVDCGAHGVAEGFAAELMMPRWFDKRADRTQADNVSDLGRALEAAADAYTTAEAAPAFALFARHYDSLTAHGAALGRTALSTAFGQAVLDRAVLDALCRATEVSVYAAIQRNMVGMAGAPPIDDLRGWDWNAWLAKRTPADHLQARHTVGMLDLLEGDTEDAAGLPVSLPAVVRRYGHRYFKIKLGGNPETDLQRLQEVLATLDAIAPGHQFTLDGNEQYADTYALRALCKGLRHMPQLAARPEALLYLEQPLPRDASMDPALLELQTSSPLLLDEADGTLDAFREGRSHGWRGVSSKACKGFYKALINRARCDLWNSADEGRHYFMSAEDLTCQAGLAVQQDLALASLLGLAHCERNGHHYVDGFGNAPADEQAAFAAAHSDLYETSAGRPRLAIRNGRIEIGSLANSGFAHSAVPDFAGLHPLSLASTFV